MASAESIVDAINRVYERKDEAAASSRPTTTSAPKNELDDILDSDDEAPIIRWVNSLLFQAVEGARERHPHRAGREGGHRPLPHRRRALRRQARRKQFMSSIIARVKIMAALNIAEKRLPQDGRIRSKIAGKDIDIRVSTIPTSRGGERIVMRLLDKSSVLLDLADLGFAPRDYALDGRRSSAGPTASSWSPGPTGSRQDDHALRVPRTDQPRRTSTSSPSRIRSSTSSTASPRCTSTRRSS